MKKIDGWITISAATLQMNTDKEHNRRMDCLDWFRGEMAKKLEERIPRGDWTAEGWSKNPMATLYRWLIEEVRELEDSMLGGGNDQDIIGEAVDVANYAMAIADVARRRGNG